MSLSVATAEADTNNQSVPVNRNVWKILRIKNYGVAIFRERIKNGKAYLLISK